SFLSMSSSESSFAILWISPMVGAFCASHRIGQGGSGYRLRATGYGFSWLPQKPETRSLKPASAHLGDEILGPEPGRSLLGLLGGLDELADPAVYRDRNPVPFTEADDLPVQVLDLRSPAPLEVLPHRGPGGGVDFDHRPGDQEKQGVRER